MFAYSESIVKMCEYLKRSCINQYHKCVIIIAKISLSSELVHYEAYNTAYLERNSLLIVCFIHRLLMTRRRFQHTTGLVARLIATTYVIAQTILNLPHICYCVLCLYNANFNRKRRKTSNRQKGNIRVYDEIVVKKKFRLRSI